MTNAISSTRPRRTVAAPVIPAPLARDQPLSAWGLYPKIRLLGPVAARIARIGYTTRLDQTEMLEVHRVWYPIKRGRLPDALKPHPKIHWQCNTHDRARVKSNDGRVVSPRADYACFDQSPADTVPAGRGIDHEHPHNRPRPVEKRGFGSSWRHIDDGADYSAIRSGHDYLPDLGQRRHPSEPCLHRGPVGVFGTKLLERPNREVIDHGGVTVCKCPQSVIDHLTFTRFSCAPNTNQSISSVTGASGSIAAPGERIAAIPSSKSLSDSRARKESARKADFSTKLRQSDATTWVTTSRLIALKRASMKTRSMSSREGSCDSISGSNFGKKGLCGKFSSRVPLRTQTTPSRRSTRRHSRATAGGSLRW